MIRYINLNDFSAQAWNTIDFVSTYPIPGGTNIEQKYGISGQYDIYDPSAILKIGSHGLLNIGSYRDCIPYKRIGNWYPHVEASCKITGSYVPGMLIKSAEKQNTFSTIKINRVYERRNQFNCKPVIFRAYIDVNNTIAPSYLNKTISPQGWVPFYYNSNERVKVTINPKANSHRFYSNNGLLTSTFERSFFMRGFEAAQEKFPGTYYSWNLMTNGALHFTINLSDIYECNYPNLSVTRNDDLSDRLFYVIQVHNNHPFSMTVKWCKWACSSAAEALNPANLNSAEINLPSGKSITNSFYADYPPNIHDYNTYWFSCAYKIDGVYYIAAINGKKGSIVTQRAIVRY